MVTRAKLRHRAKFSGDRSNCCWDLGFFKCGNFNARNSQEGQIASSRQSLWQSVQPLEILQFSFFQDGGHPHFGFLNFPNFNGRNGQEGRTPSPSHLFHGDRPNCCGDMAIFFWLFQDGGHPPSTAAILDLWCTCLDRPWRPFGRLYHFVKIWLESIQQFR